MSFTESRQDHPDEPAIADPDWFRLVPQSCITQKIFENTRHNAIWDFYVTPKGRVFLSLCAEINYPEMVRLYEYLPVTNQLRLCFQLEDRVLQWPQAIRASKIHTSLCQVRDGRLIMTTHTTARSLLHPDWMPEAYYSHPWEGFQGSNILLYDPDTGALENRGIPVPHESIYGAKYDASHDALYFTGYLRGHLYRLDLPTNRLTDYGKVTEYGSFRLAEGPDGNLYCSSRSGNFFRINTSTQRIEELGLELPDNNGKYTRNHRVITFTAIHGDRLYFTSCYSKGLWSYHPSSNTLRHEGDFLPPIGVATPDPDAETIFAYAGWGLTIDDQGCFWYGVSNSAMHLVKWDFFKGEPPRHMGVIGTRERAVIILSEMHFYQGKLYLSDTNHSYDAPGVAVIDLEKLEAAVKSREERPITRDGLPYYLYRQAFQNGSLGYRLPREAAGLTLSQIYPGGALEEVLEQIRIAEEPSAELIRFREKNEFRFCRACAPIHLWKWLGPEKSAVYALWFREGVLYAVVGDEREKVLLTLVEGKITSSRPTRWDPEPMPEELLGLSYPFYPGRQYKAVPSAFADWNGGRRIVGTKDGMLCIVSGESVYSMGTTGPNGAVNAMAVNGDKTVLYGVSGDEMDMGNLFSYDDKNGLRWLGLAHRETFDDGVTMVANELSAVALEEGGGRLAVGSKDRIGVVLVYELE